MEMAGNFFAGMEMEVAGKSGNGRVVRVRTVRQTAKYEAEKAT